MPTIAPHLWYTKDAEKAAAFYASIFPDSRVDKVTGSASDSPSGPPGSVVIVEFTLMGAPFRAISAGEYDPFNHAVSFMVECDTQDEIDSYWNALLEGGTPEQCGWIRDRYGLSWQIVPRELGILASDPNPAKAKATFEAMLKMVRLDIATLKAAHAAA